MDKLTEKLHQIMDEYAQGNITGIGIVLQYTDGKNQIFRCNMETSDMLNCIETECAMHNFLDTLPGCD